MVTIMHDTKIATKDAGKEKWVEGCLVISELDARTIWVYDTDLVKCPRLKSAARIANEAIEKLTEKVKSGHG
jgi:hypothetical protein